MNHSRLRGIAVLLMVFLLCQFTAAPAFALMFPGYGGESTGPVYLCSSPDNLSKDILVLEAGQAASAPPDGAMWIFFDTSGRPQIVPVSWNIDDEVLSEPGLHQMTGYATTSSSIQLAEGYNGMITWPVFRKGNDAVLNLQSAGIPAIRSRLVPEGSDTASLHETLQLTERVTECMAGDFWMLETIDDPAFRWVWDTSAVDTGRIGYQPVSVTLQYPDWVHVPEEYRRFSEAVFVMPADRIELQAPVSVDLNGKLTFQWLYDAQNVTGSALFWKTDDTAMQPCDESWYTFVSANSASSGSLLLKLYALPTGTPLTFQLRYYDTIDGVTAQHFTEPVTFTVPENLDELLTKHISIILDELTGDRDGGDQGEITLPDYSQPAPVTPPDENSSDDEPNSESGREDYNDDKDADDKTDIPERPDYSERFDNSDDAALHPVQETVTDTYTEIGGKRLALLTSLASSVLFEKQGVAAEIPSALLNRLALAENQLLKVTLLHPDSATVQISVLANGRHVEDLTGTVIAMPWNAPGSQEDTAYFCTDHTGRITGPAVYDAQSGMLRFAITAPGTWHITKQQTASAPAADTSLTAGQNHEPDMPAANYPAPANDSRYTEGQPEDILPNPAENTPEPHAAADTDSADINSVDISLSDTNSAASPNTLPAGLLIPVLLLTGGAILLVAGRWRR